MTTTLTTASDTYARNVARSDELEAEIATDPSRFRVLTGDRPTGPLHLGHYCGTLAHRIRLQRAGVEVLVLVADYQVVTGRDRPERLPETVSGLVLDQLAAGLDPERTTFFCQSAVPALNQLLLPFLSLVSTAELERNPTVRSEANGAARGAVPGPGAGGVRRRIRRPRRQGARGRRDRGRQRVPAPAAPPVGRAGHGPGSARDLLRRGNQRAGELADAPLDAVRAAMGMRY